MIRILMVLWALALAADAQKVTNLNKVFDEKFNNTNQRSTVAPIPIQYNLTVPGKIELSDGQFLGNTIERTGDFTETAFENGTLRYDYHIGFKKFQVPVKQATIDGEKLGPGVFNVGQNSLHIAYSIDLKNRSCVPKVVQYGFKRLDEVTFKSESGAEKDVSELFRNTVVPELNRVIPDSTTMRLLVPHEVSQNCERLLAMNAPPSIGSKHESIVGRIGK